MMLICLFDFTILAVKPDQSLLQFFQPFVSHYGNKDDKFLFLYLLGGNRFLTHTWKQLLFRPDAMQDFFITLQLIFLMVSDISIGVAAAAYDKVSGLVWKLTHTHQQKKLKYGTIDKQTSVESLFSYFF